MQRIIMLLVPHPIKSDLVHKSRSSKRLPKSVILIERNIAGHFLSLL